MDRLLAFLFANKTPANPDPVWLIVLVALWGAGLILLGVFGKKIFPKDQFPALHKTLKKSSGWLKAFGIIYLLLLWFRLETVRVLSMKLWFVLADIAFIWILFLKTRYYLALKRRIEKRATAKKKKKK